MGSKRFRNKTCVYCGLEQGANTADHVIAREFFLLAGRDNLPKVPACEECNTAKSRLEHYVLSVLLMGGVHGDALEALATQLAPRLAKNDALRRTLFIGQRDRMIRQPDGTWASGMSVPFDGEQLAILCCYIALGLAWHHWHLQIAPHAVASANMFTRPGQATFEDMLVRCEAGGPSRTNDRKRCVRVPWRVFAHQSTHHFMADEVLWWRRARQLSSAR
ncbi:HNH endonuclease [Burkholderia metallica]|uniref:HNH endonuclease n=1 Tax=Burkholderia cepacia complex TaxID=87882 RepID=UPI001452B5D9|nr:hypothetical protein [Burkholderia metallica]VWC26490.1 hypothetical protein BME24068_06127 [Burkholderia metallica]